ncbi:unnamed protein product [Staphylococcus haemolyticus JCSC1435]|uniref:Uncharacterized protein n=1 Tax=Staphylococcus haemolyticus (strain JCSC1435) TaxID=279808 RepID=Q4L477_STAHJ|nr:unnamed protein product [Staphylococcus haemolyticus JCSC1435]
MLIHLIEKATRIIIRIAFKIKTFTFNCKVLLF